MEENQGHRKGAPVAGAPDQCYELDLDQHSSVELDEAIREAVDAVERGGKPGPESTPGARSMEDREEAAGEADAAEEPGAPEEAGVPEEPGGPEKAGVAEETAVPAADEPVDDAAKLRADAETLRSRLMRTLADFDNYRKRTEREKGALRRMGIFEVVRDFLDVFDNLERALESSGSVDDLKQGLRMVLRQQEQVLRRHGVEKIESVGRPFDPTLHEAVTRGETADVEVPTVTAELQKGYLLYDRLLRPSMVQVAMPRAGAVEEAATPAIDETATRDQEVG